jgi:hypothetical protein
LSLVNRPITASARSVCSSVMARVGLLTMLTAAEQRRLAN